MSELHIDRAYLSSTLVRDRAEDLEIFCKAWPVRNTTGRYTKAAFTLDFDAGRLTCPNRVAMPFTPGRTVRFPKDTCAACPLREQCTTSTAGRSVNVHPDEALLAELRERQATPAGRARLRERTTVEHTLAHVGRWQGRRARYLGLRKNLFDLRRTAAVHNLHSSPAGKPLSGPAEGGERAELPRAARQVGPDGWAASRPATGGGFGGRDDCARVATGVSVRHTGLPGGRLRLRHVHRDSALAT